MYLIIQTIHPTNDMGSNHYFFGLSDRLSFRRHTGEQFFGSNYSSLVGAINSLRREDFNDVHLGFYLVLE